MITKSLENPSIEGLPSITDVKRIKDWLSNHDDRYKMETVRFYHGAKASDLENIMQTGLLPTSNTRKKSYQSTNGYVYLANTPQRAKMFGDLSNSGNSAVLEVHVLVVALKADIDQLNNQRSVSIKVGNTVAESIVFGGGVRIKGRIFPYALRTLSDVQYSKVVVPAAQGVTLKAVQNWFKGQQVWLSPDKSINIELQNGAHLQIKTVDQLFDDSLVFSVNQPNSSEGKLIIAGQYQNNKIRLAKGVAGQFTLNHELIHWFEDIGLITPKDTRLIDHTALDWQKKGRLNFSLNDDGDQAEDRANFLAQFLIEREQYRSTSFGPLLQKIGDFLDALWNLGQQSIRQMAKNMESGKLFEKQVDDETQVSLGSQGEQLELQNSSILNTSTQAFQDWFGKSKVVDAQGDPLVVYHGTNTENNFKEWQVAKNWDKFASDEADGLDQIGNGNYNAIEGTGFVDEIKRLGYDGFTTYEQEGKNYAVFNPTQIKSIYNRGTWSKTDSRIKYSTMPMANTWFSQMEHVLELKLNNAPALILKQQIQSWVKKGEFKQEELEWSGLLEWLDTQKGKVEKQEVLDYLRQNQIVIEEVIKSLSSPVSAKGKLDDDAASELWHQVKREMPDSTNSEIGIEVDRRADRMLTTINTTEYSQYQLKGGEHYKELLLLLPVKQGKYQIPNGWNIAQNKCGVYNFKLINETGEIVVLGDSKEQILQRYYGAMVAKRGDAYTSKHWQEENVLAHVRFSERTVDGLKILHIEELQSDLHQEGRKNGYGEKGKYAVFNNEAAVGEYASRGEAETALKNAGGKGIPNAPWKKTWPIQTFKRMVRYAAENGFDSVAWTQGKEQTDRYDLSKQVDLISAVKGDNGKWHIWANKDENQVFKKESTESELPNLVGKDLAEKIIKQKEVYKEYSGLDLKIGGKGMEGFYDKILPAEINRFFNKAAWGNAKVDTIDIGLEDCLLWNLPITPQMRSKALFEGMPQFSKVSQSDLTSFQKPFEDLTIVDQPEDLDEQENSCGPKS